jgi:hypothetical protein
VLAFGCGGQSVGEQEAPPPSCVSLCEKGKDARCPRSELLMCEENCLSEDYLVERSGCRSDYNPMLVCTGSIDDICDVLDQCRPEYDALVACYHDYCEDHGSEPGCERFR